MEKSTYPSNIGVPSLALIGVSGAGKSSLAGKLIPKPICIAAKIAGKSSAQTTLIPTQFYIKGYAKDGPKDELSESATSFLFRVTLRSFPVQDDEMKVDEEAVFSAVQHCITSFVRGSKGSGIPISALNEYIDSGKYVQDLRSNVNGAVRLEKIVSDEFDSCAETCAKSLLENFDVSEIDSSVSKLKGDADKAQTKIITLRHLLRQRWDNERKNKQSPVCALLRLICRVVWAEIESLLPEISGKGRQFSFSFDMENDEDKMAFTALLDPYAPLSLIVEKYEVACGMSEAFKKLFAKSAEHWPDKRLPFRLILTDTVGLTQDAQENDDDITKRLRAALNSGCQGVLLMMPASLRDEKKRAIQRSFSTRNEEGRQIRRNEIPVFLGISRVDEEITPQTDSDEDLEFFAEEMGTIWNDLTETRIELQHQFNALESRYLTNQPKKIAAYLDDLRKANNALADELDKHLGIRSSIEYIYNITTTLQTRLFPSETKRPIFFKALQPVDNGRHIRLRVISRNCVEEMAAALATASKNYFFEHWLHWNTAYAFNGSVRGGYKFISRAEQNGRIYVYIDGDAKNASNTVRWKVLDKFEPEQVQLNGIDLKSSESKSLYDTLNLNSQTDTDDDVKLALKGLFLKYFSENSSWRFHRAMDRTIRRLSFEDARIRDKALQEFETGRLNRDASYGVECMLTFYRGFYQSPQLADIIEDILNEEMSNEFNNFFFPLY